MGLKSENECVILIICGKFQGQMKKPDTERKFAMYETMMDTIGFVEKYDAEVGEAMNRSWFASAETWS